MIPVFAWADSRLRLFLKARETASSGLITRTGGGAAWSWPKSRTPHREALNMIQAARRGPCPRRFPPGDPRGIPRNRRWKIDIVMTPSYPKGTR